MKETCAKTWSDRVVKFVKCYKFVKLGIELVALSHALNKTDYTVKHDRRKFRANCLIVMNNIFIVFVYFHVKITKNRCDFNICMLVINYFFVYPNK